MRIFPRRLKKGDTIRVIAPSRNACIFSDKAVNISTRRLEELGLIVTFGKNVRNEDLFGCASIEDRVADIHDAFLDKKVAGVITVIGGFNSNQILNCIDYDIIKKNPKIFCGFSDITNLNNAFYSKSGLINYSGPHFSSFGMEDGFEYSLEYFKKALFDEGKIVVEPSSHWSDDEWYLDNPKRDYIENNDAHLVINEGICDGTIIGGNLSTLSLLKGTEFMVFPENTVLFIEDCDEDPSILDALLQGLILLPDFKRVRGLVIGRTNKESDLKNELLIKMIRQKKELNHIPVIANINFGHTTPIITFPIGGEVHIDTTNKNKIKIINE